MDIDPQAERVSELLKAKRVWLKAFWGFGPEEDGYLGFTRSADRQRLIDQWEPGDLVLIYGAGSANTDAKDRRQALGFLEIDPIPVTDQERMSKIGLPAIQKISGHKTLAMVLRYTHISDKTVDAAMDALSAALRQNRA